MDSGGAFAELVLFDMLSVNRAWEMLHDPQVTKHLDAEGYLALCLDAGYSQVESERAAKAWAFRRLQLDLPA